jgi:hypothetical protein
VVKKARGFLDLIRTAAESPVNIAFANAFDLANMMPTS